MIQRHAMQLMENGHHKIFADGDEYVLRPIFFAHEDREQITELLVETYNQLAVAASVVANIVISGATL